MRAGRQVLTPGRLIRCNQCAQGDSLRSPNCWAHGCKVGSCAGARDNYTMNEFTMREDLAGLPLEARIQCQWRWCCFDDCNGPERRMQKTQVSVPTKSGLDTRALL